MRQDLAHNVFEAFTPSPEQKERMLTQILNAAKTEPVKRRARRAISGLAVAFTLVFCLGASALARNFDTFSQTIQSFLGGPTQALGMAVSDQGYTVKAETIFGDMHNAYILFSLSRDDNKPLDQEMYFQNFDLDIVEATEGYGFTISSLQDDNLQDNKRQFCLQLDSPGDIVGKKATITLEGLYPENLSAMAFGKWEFSFPLVYEDQAQIYPLKQTIPYQDMQVVLDSIVLSPLSCSFAISAADSDTFASFCETAFGDALTPLIQLELQDGTILEENSAWGDYMSCKYFCQIGFNRLVSAKEIKNFYINGICFPFPQK